MPEPSINPEHLLEPSELRLLQRTKLSTMLQSVLRGNAFYRKKFEGIDFDAMNDPMQRLPFTTRPELEADQKANPVFGTNLTNDLEDYTRYHQTSGSKGTPLRWLDTPESWGWWRDCWRDIFAAAGITRSDRVMFAFSFGPFIGFWSAFAGAEALGAMCIPAGGLSSEVRLKMMLDGEATVLCCTPTYAMRLADAAREAGVDLSQATVRKIVVAGEPGGSIPVVRSRIESAWNARLFDHWGMTELGPLAFECLPVTYGMHIMENWCIAEVIDPVTEQPIEDDEVLEGELVVTNLGRAGSPLIRYRTGDRVRMLRRRCACGRHFAWLEGGIIGRSDDMIQVRGNNVFPSAIEAILRRLPDVAEFRVHVYDSESMAELSVELEPTPEANHAALMAEAERFLQMHLGFRTRVSLVAPGSLPRFEMKARRFIREKRSD